MGQFQEATNAMEAMANSGGALEDAYAEYSNSIQKHVNTLKASFQDLSTTVINSNLLKGLADGGAGILDFVNKLVSGLDKIGGIIPIIASVGASLFSKAFVSNIPNYLKALEKFTKGFSNLGKAMSFLFGSRQGPIQSWASFFEPSTIGAIVGLLTLAAYVIPKIVKELRPKSLEDLKQEVVEINEEIDDTRQKTEQTKERINELNELKQNNAISSAEEAELNRLETQNQYYEAQLELLERIAEYKQQKVVSRANEEAVDAFSSFMENDSRTKTIGNGTTSSFWGEGSYLPSVDGYGGLLNAIDAYTKAKADLDHAYAALEDADYDPEKDAARLEAYRENVEEKQALVDQYSSTLEGFMDMLIGWRGQMTDDAAIASIDSLLDSITGALGLTEANESFESFSSNIKKLSADAQKALYAVTKGEKQLVDESGKLTKEGQEVVEWLKDTGLSAEDAAVYLARWASELSDTTITGPTVDTSGAVADLASLRDELQQTSAAIEKYNKSMEGGEKGAANDTFRSAWKSAMDLREEGKVDTNAMRGAASLILSEEKLRELNYDLGAIGKTLNGKMFKSIFGEDGSDMGKNFANYLRKNAGDYSDFVDVVDNGNDSFSLAISSFDGLAKQMGISTAFMYSLLDGMDAFGKEVMLDGKRVSELSTQFKKFRDNATDKSGNKLTGKDARREGVRGLINSMLEGGMDEYSVMATMRALKNSSEMKNLLDGFGKETFSSMIEKWLSDQRNGQNKEDQSGDQEKNLEDLKNKYTQLIQDLQSTVDGSPLTIKITAADLAGGEFDIHKYVPEDGGSVTFVCDSQGTAEKLQEQLNGLKNSGGEITYTVKYVDADGNTTVLPGNGDVAPPTTKGGGRSGKGGSTGIDYFDPNASPKTYGDRSRRDSHNLANLLPRWIKRNFDGGGEDPAAAYFDSITEAAEEAEAAVSQTNDAITNTGTDGSGQDETVDGYREIEKAAGEAAEAVDGVSREAPKESGLAELKNQYTELQQAVADAQAAYDEAASKPNPFAGTSELADLAQAQSALKEFENAHPEVTLEAESNVQEIVEQAEEELDAVENKEVEVNTVADTTGVEAAAGALASLPSSKTISIDFKVRNKPGLAQLASGTRNAPGGPTLVNELGPELISEKGRAYIAGGGLPTIVNLSKGAIVLDAEDTKKALSGKKPISGDIDAAVRGRVPKPSDLVKQYTDTGTGKWKDDYGVINTTINNAKKKPKQKYYDNGNNSAKKNEDEDKKNKVDWIEVAIDRLTRAIDSLEKVFDSAFRTLDKRMSASNKEIAKIQEGFKTYQDGYERYLKEAESVGLDASIAALVKNGTIDIGKYDDDTKKKIDEFKQWYEKAIDCKEAIDDLHVSLAELYQERFDIVQTNYENQLAQLEHQATMVEKSIDMVEQKGYLGSASLYKELASNESKNISKLKAELSDLNKYFDEAMKSGEIDKGSEAWYEMQESISSVEEAIADANIQLVEYQKNIREINWEYFDFAQERFSQLTAEAEFYISLMQNDELFDDRGQLTEAGMSTVGMRVMNYDAYMAQADAYAKEMKKIQSDLAKDPYDTELIKRREELLGLQQEFILSAEGEKDAVRDMVENGINKELSALKELIDAYKDSVDSAKDLYEYQKKVSEKTQDIATIQKQLAAYAGDTSEENRSRVQKLNEELKKTQEELKEAERDQSISEQKKLLDDLYDGYEELLNERLDNVDTLMADMITETNGNLMDIRDEIQTISKAVGYTATEGMQSMLYGDFANYNKGFETFQSMTGYLDEIYKSVDAMARASGAVKAYASGGLADYTGYAMLHGTKTRPELVLNAADTENFLSAAALLRQTPTLSALGSRSFQAAGGGIGGGGGTTIGSLYVTIPIDHVQDYNDMLSQMRDDPKFERLISVMTLDAAVGKSSFRKNSIKF